MPKTCLEEVLVIKTFNLLIDSEIPEYRGREKTVWVKKEVAMEMLGITSQTSLHKLRNEGAIEYTTVLPKNILYDRNSINDYLESKRQKRFTI